jgi:heme/copper-type cytochrome/quinol oxidase subunit 2
MEVNMTKELTHAESYDFVGNQTSPAENKNKKKVSWLHTILWMLSMVFLANVMMGIIAYFLFFYHK